MVALGPETVGQLFAEGSLEVVGLEVSVQQLVSVDSMHDKPGVLELLGALEEVALGVTQVVALSHIPLVSGSHLEIIRAFHRDEALVLGIHQVREVDFGLLVVLEGVEVLEDSVESDSLVNEHFDVLRADQRQLMVEACQN